MTTRTTQLIAFAALTLALLSACGNKGDLYRDSEAASSRGAAADQNLRIASPETVGSAVARR